MRFGSRDPDVLPDGRATRGRYIPQGARATPRHEPARSDGAAASVVSVEEDQRSRILRSALHMFAARGFDGVGTRAIATDARSRMSAITYHFGGKQQLHLAVVRSAAGRLRARAGPLLAEARRTPRSLDGLLEILDQLRLRLNGPDVVVERRLVARTLHLDEEGSREVHDLLVGPIIADMAGLLLTWLRGRRDSRDAVGVALEIWQGIEVDHLTRATMVPLSAAAGWDPPGHDVFEIALQSSYIAAAAALITGWSRCRPLHDESGSATCERSSLFPS